MDLSVRTLAITAKPNASRAEASSQSSSPRASMPCRTSTALRTTTGWILEFFLCALFGQDRLSKARFYTFTGLSAGSIFRCDDSGRLRRLPSGFGRSGLLSGKLGQPQRASMRFSHEAVNHVVCVEEISRHRPVWSNAEDEDARARARNVELDDGAVFTANKAVIYICIVN